MEAGFGLQAGEVAVDRAALPEDEVAVDEHRDLAVGVEGAEVAGLGLRVAEIDVDDLEVEAELGGDGADAERVGGEAGVVEFSWHQPFCSIRRPRSSAICTALSAAPLRRLSETTQSIRPLSTVGSVRMRLTKVA